MSEIWINNPIILLDKYWDVTLNNDFNENINRITRIGIYLIILCLLFSKEDPYITILIALLIVINIYGLANKKELFDINNNIESVYITSDNEYKIGPVYNITADDYDKVKDGEDLRDIMKNKREDKIYKMITESFSTKNLDRTFYTMPIQNIPNDQENFSNWLYKKESFKVNEDNMPFMSETYSVSSR